MDRPKVGVFVCHCGSEISEVVDVCDVVEYAGQLPGVVFAQDSLKACTDSGRREIVRHISDLGLNRIVLAGCSPRTHEPLFRAMCQEAGLNPYLFECVNIRDQCARVHTEAGEEATTKARDLVRMGVARALLLEPLERTRLPVVPVALVIGAGIAGLSAAHNLARQGFQVKLVERELEAGGQLRELFRLYPTGEDARDYIEQKSKAVSDHPNVELLLGAEICNVTGSVGNYGVTVQQGDHQLELVVGAIIVATGAQEFKPLGMYAYDGERIITQGELEPLLAQGIRDGDRAIDSVVMIQCVGARDEVRPYCSRVCCMTAVKNALLIKEAEPSVQVYVLYRDMLTLGTKYEDLYREARGAGVIFMRYDPQMPPEVRGDTVVVQDSLLGEELQILSDLVVLSTPLVSADGSAGLAQMLQVPTGEMGFFSEAHPKYRPLDSDRDGVFLCGSAHWPSDVGESVGQALGAAARASILLRQREIETEARVAVVDVSKCSACGFCETICNFGAVEVTIVDERRGIKAARVDESRCKGCGACVAGCLCRAIDLLGSTNEQLLAVINAL